MTLYTDEVKKFAKNLQCPQRGIRWDVVEFPLADPPQLRIYLYKDNIMSYPDHTMDGITDWVNKLMTGIRNLGVPCFLEVVE